MHARKRKISPNMAIILIIYYRCERISNFLFLKERLYLINAMVHFHPINKVAKSMYLLN